MKMLDFNAVEQPIWEIKLKDDEHTVVALSAPTTELVDRLVAATPTLQKAAKTKDVNTIRAVFALVADVMNCNESGLTFTADDLRDKYRLNLLDIFKFVPGYLEFINEMQNAKN